MPEPNVYFFGLICHVDINDNGRPDYAAIVRAPKHDAWIYFEDDDGPI